MSILFLKLFLSSMRVRLTSYDKRDFGLVDTRHMVTTMYVNIPLRLSIPKPMVERGIVMGGGGHNESGVQCNYIKAVGLLKTILSLRRRNTGMEPILH